MLNFGTIKIVTIFSTRYPPPDNHIDDQIVMCLQYTGIPVYDHAIMWCTGTVLLYSNVVLTLPMYVLPNFSGFLCTKPEKLREGERGEKLKLSVIHLGIKLSLLSPSSKLSRD